MDFYVLDTFMSQIQTCADVALDLMQEPNAAVAYFLYANLIELIKPNLQVLFIFCLCVCSF